MIPDLIWQMLTAYNLRIPDDWIYRYGLDPQSFFRQWVFLSCRPVTAAGILSLLIVSGRSAATTIRERLNSYTKDKGFGGNNPMPSLHGGKWGDHDFK